MCINLKENILNKKRRRKETQQLPLDIKKTLPVSEKQHILNDLPGCVGFFMYDGKGEKKKSCSIAQRVRELFFFHPPMPQMFTRVVLRLRMCVQEFSSTR